MDVPRTLDLHDLRRRAWSHRAGPFGALDHVFDVHLPDEGLALPVEHALRPLATDAQPTSSYHIVAVDGTRDGRYGLFCDGERLVDPVARERVVAFLLWQVNHEASVRTKGRLLVHAGVAATADALVVLPGPMGAGKSTLTAALVQSGLTYFSDEMAPIDPGTLLVESYPRAIALTATARQDLGLDDRDLGASEWWSVKWPVDPVLFGGRACAEGSRPVSLIVAPTHVKGASVEVAPMPPADAVVYLGQQAFNLQQMPQSGLAALAAICQKVPCYRLRSGNLADARAAVLDLLHSVPS